MDVRSPLMWSRMPEPLDLVNDSPSVDDRTSKVHSQGENPCHDSSDPLAHVVPVANSTGATVNAVAVDDREEFFTGIAYARAKGLVLEHIVPPDEYMSMARQFGEHCLVATGPDGLTESKDLKHLVIPTLNLPGDGIVLVSARRIAAFFDTVFGADEFRGQGLSEFEHVFTSGAARWMKFEEMKLGGLAGGNEQDLLKYRRLVRMWSTAKLEDHWMPFEWNSRLESEESSSPQSSQHAEAAEELDDWTFDGSYKDKDDCTYPRAGAALTTETLGNDILLNADRPSHMPPVGLASFLDSPYDEMDECNVMDEHLPAYTGLSSMYLTPVLTPASSVAAMSDFNLEEEISLEIVSSSNTVPNSDIMTAEVALGIRAEKLDGKLPSDTPPLPPSSPVAFPEEAEMEEFRIETLKVEVPLVDILSRPPESEAKTPVQLVAEDRPIATGSEEERTVADDNFSSFADEELRTVTASSGRNVMRKIEQEKIDRTDAIARFDVPVLDFSIPAPGWARLTSNSKEHFAWLRNAHPDAFNLPACLRDAEERNMVWNPLKDIPCPVIPDDTIEHCGEHLKRFVDGLKPASDYTPLAARKDGLMILDIIDDDEGDDEITTASATVCSASTAHESSSSSPSSPDVLMRVVLKRKQQLDDDPQRRKRSKDGDCQTSLLDTSDLNPVATLLNSYMQMHFPERTQPAPGGPGPLSEQLATVELAPEETLSKAAKAPPKQIAVALPETGPLPAFPCTFIASLGCIKLTREIARLWPGVTFIDRDFTRHNDYVNGVASALSYEADILVSPSTGIIVTTLQKVLQKSLPGSSALTQLRERVLRVSALYERLLVFVSEDHETPEDASGFAADIGASHDTVSEVSSPATLAAYSSFAAFAASLSRAGYGRVTVAYVAGGRVALARWTMAAMSRHATELGGEVLAEPESTWEILLRRAGMGLFAAQMVLSAARSTQERVGLAALLGQSPEERREWLGRYVGSTRVLDRVGDLLDQPW